MKSIRQFDDLPYSIPEDNLETDERLTLKLSPDKKTVSADFTTYDGKDGFCAKTTEGPIVPVGRMMMLDVWTNVTKVRVGGQTHSLWPEYSVFLGNEAVPRCDATAATKAYGCRFDAVRTKLIEGNESLGLVNAEFVGSEGIPATLKAGEQADVKIKMKNTGTSAWTKTGINPFVLAARNPLGDNRRWGISRVELPAGKTIVQPGEEVIFAFKITAPSKVGTYDFQWQMYQVPVEYFGQKAPTPVVKINVLSSTKLSATPTTIQAGGIVTAEWRGVKSPTTTDWIGLYKPGAEAGAYEEWIYTSTCSQSPGVTAKASGSCPFKVPASTTQGTYELRLYAFDQVSDEFLLAKSSSFSVTG